MKLKDKDFKIEYYPLTNRYHPIYKGNYLYKNFNTGIFKLESYMEYCQCGKTEKEAIEIIKLFREQQFKENILILPFYSNCIDCKKGE